MGVEYLGIIMTTEPYCSLRRTWAEVHEQLGRKILTDRTFWAQARKVTANIQMDEDTLLVEF